MTEPLDHMEAAQIRRIVKATDLPMEEGRLEWLYRELERLTYHHAAQDGILRVAERGWQKALDKVGKDAERLRLAIDAIPGGAPDVFQAQTLTDAQGMVMAPLDGALTADDLKRVLGAVRDRVAVVRAAAETSMALSASIPDRRAPERIGALAALYATAFGRSAGISTRDVRVGPTKGDEKNQPVEGPFTRFVSAVIDEFQWEERTLNAVKAALSEHRNPK